jgi:predicted Zn finger-like uncharacterized protein
VKFLCEQCKAKYQIADEKVVGRTVRMKCRKCGHLIEVRAAVTESSVSVEFAPPAPAQGAPKAPPPRPPPKAAPPAKAAPLATGLAAAKPPPPKADRGAGALAGAFKTTVQREEEVSAPFDMSELSPGEGWYVAINGVPVGPIRMSEVRRKAALGAVTEDSLVWQEGLDEWRPARSLPEVAAIVREAAASGRSSLTPPPPGGRSSTPPPPRTTTSTRPASGGSGGIAPRAARPPSSPLSASARSNVVPFMSRLATAERLEESPAESGRASSPPQAGEIEPIVVPDPFAPSAAAGMAPPPGSAGVARSAAFSLPPVAPKKPVPWLALAMVAGAIAFGVTAGLTRSPAPAPVVQAPAAPTVVSTAAVNTGATTASPESAPTSNQVVTKTSTTTGGGPKTAIATGAAATTATAGGRSLDLHSLTQNSNVAPTAEDPNEGPKAPGQCFSQGQVQSVIGMHQLAIRRSCWERDPTTKPTVNVSVSMTIGTDGSAQAVAASGDESSVVKCIENDVRGWHFPAMGCSQKTGFSFKFVRQ